MSIPGFDSRECQETMRPLPELTPANEWFWTSGADGVLRIQGAATAAAGAPAGSHLPLLPEPVVEAGPGLGPRHDRRVHGQRPPLAAGLRSAVRDRQCGTGRGPPRPPHDQHRQLRTADVQIGQEVSVQFEQQEDVWLPLFELTGATRPRRPRRRTGAAPPTRPPQ
jgi:hypothetical protein